MAISLQSPNTDNYYVGKGIVSMKLPTDADWVDIGNVPEFEYTPNIDKLDHFSSRAGVRSKDRTIVREKSAQIRMIMEEWTARNLALVLMGAVNDTDPGNTTIEIYSQNTISCQLRFAGTNEVGPKWSFEFPKVEFTPSSSINPISDEWGQIEVTGDVLFNEPTSSFGTATADFSES